MQSRSLALALAAILLLAFAPAAAQRRVKLPEPEWERETVVDDDGLQQWKEWKASCGECQGLKTTECFVCWGGKLESCPRCEGEKRGPCRTCQGTATPPDPLSGSICMYCNGGGWYHCVLCGGKGAFPVADEPKPRPCGACKKAGFFPCNVCDGTGRLAIVQVKRKPLEEAKLKDLKATRELFEKCIEDLRGFEPTKKISKTGKALAKLCKKAGKAYPPLEKMQPLAEEVLKGLTKAGSDFTSYEANVIEQYWLFTDRSIWLLQYQIKVLDLYIARAEFNAAVLAEKK